MFGSLLKETHIVPRYCNIRNSHSQLYNKLTCNQLCDTKPSAGGTLLTGNLLPIGDNESKPNGTMNHKVSSLYCLCFISYFWPTEQQHLGVHHKLLYLSIRFTHQGNISWSIYFYSPRESCIKLSTRKQLQLLSPKTY